MRDNTDYKFLYECLLNTYEELLEKYKILATFIKSERKHDGQSTN